MKYNQIRSFAYILILLLTATSVSVSASASHLQKAVKCADKKAQKKYYAAAADKYEHILVQKPCKKDTTWKDSVYTVKTKLANTYMKTGNTIKAEANYSDVVKAGKADALTIFNYGRSLQANGKYVEAKDQFNKVADDASLAERKVKGFSEASEKAIHAGHSDRFDIQRQPFNTTASEYAPAYYKKGLAYTSNKAERGQASNRTMWNKEAFTDIYTVQEDAKGDLNVTDKLPAMINSHLNDGAACFNATYDEVFFTRNNKKCGKHDQLQIFSSNFNGTEWSTPKLLTFELAGVSYAHPSLSPDGNTLYFSSDMPGGFGGMDLYTTHRNGSIWEAPANVGTEVNTVANETFPFVAGDSTLYFTSDGWPGYGGMDIFHVKAEGGKYGKVHNMGANFNSQKDDLSLIADSKNRIGYFASNRDGDDDIFSFKWPAPAVKKPMEERADDRKPESLGSVKLVDGATNEPISGARIEVSNPKNPTAGAFYYTNESGVFYYDKKINAEDDVRIVKDNYRPYSVKGSGIADTKGFEVMLQPEKKKEVAVQDVPALYAMTIYYDFNKSNLTAKYTDSLKQAIELMKNPKSVIYISGFADQTGSDSYNNELSLRRVKGVMDYVAAQGIETIRIRSAYFGAVKLTPECAKTPKCAAETNKASRRVEIKVGKPE